MHIKIDKSKVYCNTRERILLIKHTVVKHLTWNWTSNMD